MVTERVDCGEIALAFFGYPTYRSKSNNSQNIMETENTDNRQEKRNFESCSDAFKSGMEDATAKAKEAAPKLKGMVTDTVFDMAYGAAYGAFFASAFANEFIPQAVKDGVAKGAAAGRDAAEKMRERARNKVKPEKEDGGDAIELPSPA